jgi:hypothetical protein
MFGVQLESKMDASPNAERLLASKRRFGGGYSKSSQYSKSLWSDRLQHPASNLASLNQNPHNYSKFRARQPDDFDC